jgi:DNA-binding NtrC family response regulator
MRTKKMVREVAKTNENAIIIGEVGTGKKYTAREIHHRSREKNRPLVTLNCTAVGDTITEEELFGVTIENELGVERKLGILEQAKSGILYMENIHELKPEYQQKFVNVIKQKKFRKQGEKKLVETKFRVLASTIDEALLKKDSFRADLFALLNAFTIHVPTLRERKQDIPNLFSQFLEQYCEEFNREIPPVPAEIFESLMEYEWHGNVLELQNTVRNLVLMSPEGELSMQYLPFEVKKHPFEFLEGKDLTDAVGEVEKYMIRKTLRRFAGNQLKSARALNISEAALRYKMKKFGLSRKAF